MSEDKDKKVSSEKDKGHKGKHMYITSIMVGAIRVTNPSKSVVKRKISELMKVSKKEGNTSTKILERTILRFRDREKVERIPNEIFPLVIMDVISNFDVSKILIDGGSSYESMYSNRFKNMGLKK